jgi:Uma2 family endonuclease
MIEAVVTSLSHHRTGPWTIDEVLSLPEQGMRHELIEGRLVESPVPANPHQMAGKRLERLFDDAAPPELEANREVNLRIGADLLIPDVMVASAEVLGGQGRFVEPADVILVAEILSPGNSKFVRAWKPQRYAEAGIPFYVEVDLTGAPRVTFLRRHGMDYVTFAGGEAGRRLRAAEPFAMEFDPGVLTGPRRSAG